MTLTLDPEWLSALSPLASAVGDLPLPGPHDIATIRNNVDTVIPLVYADWPSATDLGLVQETITFPSFDGELISMMHTHYPHQSPSHEPTTKNTSAALIYLPGGGFITGSASSYSKSSAQLATRNASNGAAVFTVDYRKAPEHPFPHATEDAYAALVYVQEHAHQLRVDTARVGLVGESAGGGVAAGVALMARDRSGEREGERGRRPGVSAQVLGFPMLDDRTLPARTDPLLEGFVGAGGWSYVDNLSGWTAYLAPKVSGVEGEGEGTSPYAAPARAGSLAGLPSAYLEVGELDVFREETVEYARRLMRAGVSVELRVVRGVPHGFVARAPEVEVVKDVVNSRWRALRGI